VDAPQPARRKKKKGKQALTTVPEGTPLPCNAAGEEQPAIKRKPGPSAEKGKATVQSVPVPAAGNGRIGTKVPVKVKTSGTIRPHTAGKAEHARGLQGMSKGVNAMRQAAKAGGQAIAKAVQAGTDVLVRKRRSGPDKRGASKKRRTGNQ
jgi:hypothetical protein